MSYLADYHVHSRFSIDSSEDIETYCRRAIRLGLKEITFTEHYDLHPDEPGRGYLNWERYNRAVHLCRDKYGTQLKINLGLELGEPHQYQAALRLFLQDKSVDFLLGSVHWVDGWALHENYCDHHDAKEAYERYLQEVLATVSAGGFHVLGHLDLLKRYGKKYGCLHPAQYRELILTILQVAVEKQIGLEVNTSGWRQGLGEPLPSLEIIRWYQSLGGRIITIGSDAHRVAHLGMDIHRAQSILLELGFDRIAVFSAGNLDFVSIT